MTRRTPHKFVPSLYYDDTDSKASQVQFWLAFPGPGGAAAVRSSASDDAMHGNNCALCMMLLKRFQEGMTTPNGPKYSFNWKFLYFFTTLSDYFIKLFGFGHVALHQIIIIHIDIYPKK